MEDALSKLFSDFNLEKGNNKKKVDDSAFSEWFRQKCKKINSNASEEEIINYANLCIQKIRFELNSSKPEIKGLKRITARFLKEVSNRDEKENLEKVTKRALTIELLEKLFPHWTKKEVMKATAFCYNFFKDLVQLDENAVIDRIIAFYESANKYTKLKGIPLPYFFYSYKNYRYLKDEKKYSNSSKSEEELIEEVIYANYLDFETEITLEDLKRLGISVNYLKVQEKLISKFEGFSIEYDQITDFDCTSSLQKIMNFARYVLNENFLSKSERLLFEILIDCSYLEFSKQEEFLNEVKKRAQESGISTDNYKQLIKRLKDRFLTRDDGETGKPFLMSFKQSSDEEIALDAMEELFKF